MPELPLDNLSKKPKVPLLNQPEISDPKCDDPLDEDEKTILLSFLTAENALAA